MSLLIVTITPAVKKAEVIFHYHGLPYDCTAIQPLRTSDQAFLVVSSHILFTFASQVPHLLVLNKYGEQYVKERAYVLPNSVFANARSITQNGFEFLLDNCSVIPYSSRELFILRGNGELARCLVQLEHDLFRSISLNLIGSIPTDCQCGVCIAMDGNPLLFAGSTASNSYFFDPRNAVVLDELHCQNSPANCQSITDKENHRVDDSCLLYSCGYSRPTKAHTIGGNFVIRLQQNLSLEGNAEFSIPSTLSHSLVRCLRVSESISYVVMSDGEATLTYLVNDTQFVPMNQEECPLAMDRPTLDVCLMDGGVWGCDGQVIVQVTDRGVRVVHDNSAVLTVAAVGELNFAASPVQSSPPPSLTSRRAIIAPAGILLYTAHHELLCIRPVASPEHYAASLIDVFAVRSPRFAHIQTNPITSFSFLRTRPFAAAPSVQAAAPEPSEEDEVVYSAAKLPPVRAIESLTLGEDEDVFVAEAEGAPPEAEMDVEEETEWIDVVFVAFQNDSIQVVFLLSSDV